MKQKEFLELAKKEVKELNRGDESAEQAWRDGYLYALGEIEKIMTTKYNEEACFLIEKMITDCSYLDQF